MEAMEVRTQKRQVAWNSLSIVAAFLILGILSLMFGVVRLPYLLLAGAGFIVTGMIAAAGYLIYQLIMIRLRSD